MVVSGTNQKGGPMNGGNSLRRDIALLLDEIRVRKDPKAYAEEQLPRLKDLVARYKKDADR